MISEMLRHVGAELSSGLGLVFSMPSWDNGAYLRSRVTELVGREMAGDYVPHLDRLFIHLKSTPAQRERMALVREVLEDSGQARMIGEEEV